MMTLVVVHPCRLPACADYACVSYVDEHVGAILGTLDRSGLAPETAVIFHADHVRAANQPTDRCHNSWRCDGYTTARTACHVLCRATISRAHRVRLLPPTFSC